MMTPHPSFEQTDHRPWPLPDENWTWRQTWRDLAFVHWEVDVAEIRKRIPEALEIDLYSGKAWLGVVPFDMKGVTRRGFPAPSVLSDFPEINVRTYVTYQGKSGVWFFSLDVPNLLAVGAARALFHLPYYWADIRIGVTESGYDYSHRRGERAFDASYQPTGRKRFDDGSFEIWSTERYCLYSANRRGDVFRTEVHHRKWNLESAEMQIRSNSLIDGFPIGGQHPVVLFSKSIDVVVFPMRKIGTGVR